MIPASLTLPRERTWRSSAWARLTSPAGVALLLFLTALLTRLPFQSQELYHWDSVNFSLALERFDLANDRPQPPGYPLYVGLGRLVNALTHDPQTALVGISLVSGALVAAALYGLGRVMFGNRVGLAAALLLIVSPLFWFYGEIALPHCLDALLVTVAAGGLYQTMRGNRRFLYPTVAALALAGGVRPQTLVFLLPLALYSLRKVGWKAWLAACVFGFLLCLAWFLPLIALSGGLKPYLATLNQFTERFQRTTSVFMGAGWTGLRRNLIKLALYTAYGWGLAALAPIGPILGWLRRRSLPRVSEKWVFLALWITPAALYYLLVHMGQQGLVFVFLPALMLVSAQALLGGPRSDLRRAAITLTAVGLAQAGFFIWAPEYPLGMDSQRVLTRAALVNNDRYFLERMDALRQYFPPDRTLILAANWRHLEYYLSEYRRLPFELGSKWEVDAGLPSNTPLTARTASPAELGYPLPPGESLAVVLFDPPLSAFNQDTESVKQVSLPSGETLQYLEVGAFDRLDVDAVSFGVLQEQP